MLHEPRGGNGKEFYEKFLKYKPFKYLLSQQTGTTRARTGADWHTHRLTGKEFYEAKPLSQQTGTN